MIYWLLPSNNLFCSLQKKEEHESVGQWVYEEVSRDMILFRNLPTFSLPLLIHWDKLGSGFRVNI
jgi:hypothetical protein